MKILLHDFLYSGLTNEFYLNNEIKDLSYDQIKLELTKYSYQWLPYFYLEGKKKKLDIEIIYSEDLLLQRKWCLENNFKISDNWEEKVAIEQIKKFSPDIYIFAGNFKYYKTFFKKIRDHVGYIACWISASIPNKLNLKSIDLMISDNKKILNYARAKGCDTYKMLSSIPDPNHLVKKYQNRQGNFIFTGSLGRQFKKRISYLKFLVDKKTDIKIYGMGLGEDSIFTLPIELILKKSSNYLYKYLYDKKIIPFINTLKYNVQPPVFGKSMFDILSDSKMILNMHSDYDLNYAINMRVFEALSAGCLLFTEKNRQVEKYFANEKHLIIYNNKEDLINKVNFYKSNNDKAMEIALNGRNEIIAKHTVSKRLPELLARIQ